MRKLNEIGEIAAAPPTLALSAGHYIENTGDTDLVYLEILRTDRFVDFSLNNWMRHLPPEMVSAHLKIDAESIRRIPTKKLVVIA